MPPDGMLSNEVAAMPKTLSRWRCTICGFIYDPVKGDSEYGIKPAIPFEELPEEWSSPFAMLLRRISKRSIRLLGS